MISIMLTATEWGQVNADLAAGDKIPAIKTVRDAERHRKPSAPNPLLPVSTALRAWTAGIGLKEAKEAVELLMAERGMKQSDGTPCPMPPNPTARVVPFQPIRRIICDFGEGEIEVDLEGMSLRILTGLNGSMRITDAMSLIDLYQRVKSWEEGACNPTPTVV
jgi:hypothetical protein